MESAPKKKILVPIFYRAHLGRLRSVLRAIQEHPELELLVITAAPAAHGAFFTNLRQSEPRSFVRALPWYMRAGFLSLRGKIVDAPLSQKLKKNGFPVQAEIPLFLDGGTPSVMAKSVGLGLFRVIDVMKQLKPDAVLVNADRFEMMAVAMAAAYLNIPLAHNEAGDLSGTIDESVRHAITKFAHLHFCATENSRNRVLQMGENPQYAFTTGSPVIDVLKNLNPSPFALPGIDLQKPYLLTMLHPVTTESAEENLHTVKNVISVLEKLKMPTVLIGGNSDAHSRTVGPSIVEWAKNSQYPWLFVAKWLHPDKYFRVLAHAAVAIGNSSSFIREGAFLGTPAVLVGNRQQGRERGKNVMEVESDTDKIEEAVRAQIAHGRYPQDSLFGDGNSGPKIAEILAIVNPPIQKRFYEI